MATQWVDFQAVKQLVTMQMVLEHYQVNWLRKNRNELRGRCPIHKGEGVNAFHVNVEKNCFQCFAGSCKKRGNVLDFVAAMEGCSVRDAALKLQQWFSISSENSFTSQARKPRQEEQRESRGEDEAKNKPLRFQLKGIDPHHPYLAERGISVETAKTFGVGFFAGKGSMHGRIVIPIHNEVGELLAYAGRGIDNSEEEKYKLPGGFKKSQVVYNLHRAIGKDSTVIVVEGYFDCMKLAQAGFTCVSLMGSSLSDAQADLLCKYFNGFVLMFDGDKSGQQMTDECLVKLGRRGQWVRALMLSEGAQPDGLAEAELAELLEK
jgi:DNA primase